jgi:hypothetical protein
MDKIALDPSDEFDSALIIIKAMHDKKRADYSDPDNRFSNFELSSTFANVSVPQTFEVLLGIKQARLIELLKSNKEPNNESLLDTYLDRAIYAILAYVYMKGSATNNE